MLPTLTPDASTPKPSARPESPTWAQDGHQRRGRARRHTSSSLASLRRATSAHQRRNGLSAPPPPRDLVAAVPVWHSRATMQRVIRVLAAQPYVQRLCRAQHIAVDTWAAIALNDAVDADTSTGRGMRTSQTVAAARVGRSERVVRRARAISVRLGILVELYRGRELSGDERRHLLADSPGHTQRGIPNQYAMTVCPPRQRARVSIPRAGEHAQVLPHIDGFGHLPPEGGLSLSTHLLELLTLAGADAPDQTEPPPAAQQRRRRSPGLALAVGIHHHPATGWLTHDTRPGRLAAQLTPYAHGGWSSHDLATELHHQARTAGIPTWQPPRSPYGLFKTLLQRIDPHADVHLGTGPAYPNAAPSPGTRVEPCGRPECDGHGWITHHDHTGRATSAAPCPHCPPAARTARGDELVDQAPAF